MAEGMPASPPADSSPSVDGFFLVNERSDGIYVTVFPPTGSGRGVSPADIRLRVAAYGIPDVHPEMLSRIAHEADCVPHRIAAAADSVLELAEHGSFSTNVRITEDGMRAYIDFMPHERESPEAAEKRILDELSRAGVVTGIFRSLVRELAHSKRPVREIIIAEGAWGETGVDGRIDFLYDLDPDPSPRLRPDGSVDYRERRFIHNVEAGTELLRVIPETPGFPGVGVDGRLHVPYPGKAAPRVRAGEGVGLLADGRTFRSEVSGHVSFHGGVLTVAPAVAVEGDVDFATGNLTMKGAIEILGTVRAGFSVRADGDIEIRGSVEGATVISTMGSVWIHGGIVGASRARVGAARDVVSRFIERASVVAGRSVHVDETILDSEVSAKDTVSAVSGKGQIVGGVTRAEKMIRAGTIGAASASHTEVRIEVIEAPKLYARLAELDRILAAIRAEQDRLTILHERYPRDTMGADRALDAIQASREEFDARRRIHLEERREIEKRLSNVGQGRIEVMHRAHENVLVAIGRTTQRLREPVGSGRFTREGEALKWR